MAKELGGKVVRIEIGGKPLRAPKPEVVSDTQTITWPNPTHSWNAHAIIQSGDAEPCSECETEEDKDE